MEVFARELRKSCLDNAVITSQKDDVVLNYSKFELVVLVFKH